MNNFEKTTKYENDYWSKIFKAELGKKDMQNFSSFWWENYYKELSSYIDNIAFLNNFSSVLEAGCGSGKATILLNKKLNKTLLDISKSALDYAKHTATIFNAKNINYIEGNIFYMPFKDKEFDIVWNLGVVEHYELSEIESIIEEMSRVCSKNGIIAVGIPNLYSGPIAKAILLKLLRFIPGYKIDNEKFYKTETIKEIFENVCQKNGKKIEYIKIEYFGNPLITETPKLILKTIGSLISNIFKKNKFLILITCKYEQNN
jgi:ubiquinone/menaquinone biosynthesis C-methylase UbiE